MSDITVVIDERGYRVENSKINFVVNYIDADTMYSLMAKGVKIVLEQYCIPLIVSINEIKQFIQNKQLCIRVREESIITIEKHNDILKIYVEDSNKTGLQKEGESYAEISEVLKQTIIGLKVTEVQRYNIKKLSNKCIVTKKNCIGIIQGTEIRKSTIKDDVYRHEQEFIDNLIKECNDKGIFIIETRKYYIYTWLKDLHRELDICGKYIV